MKPVIKDLGKVCITPEGDWDIKKEYANLSVVFNRNDAKVYISKQCVPKGTDILNIDYWHLLVDFDSIVNDMTALEIKNHVDNAIKEYIGDVSDEYNSLEKISNWIVSYVKTTDDKFSELRNYINNIKPVVINGNVTNAADEEDITSDENNLLKLKDRNTLNGMSYIILRISKSFKEQLTQSNTIYEIRYDFDLGGEEVEIPENCTLKFEGGSVSNGVLVGSNTHINNSANSSIFRSVNITGTYNVEVLYPEWFSNINEAVEAAHNIKVPVKLLPKTYTIDTPIEIYGDTVIVGTNQERVYGDIEAETKTKIISSDSHAFVIKTSGWGLTIKNLTILFPEGNIDYDGITNTDYATSLHFAEITDVTFINARCALNYTLYNEQLIKFSFINNIIYNALYGVKIDGKGRSNTWSNNCRVINNRFTKIKAIALYAYTALNLYDWYILENLFEYVGTNYDYDEYNAYGYAAIKLGCDNLYNFSTNYIEKNIFELCMPVRAAEGEINSNEITIDDGRIIIKPDVLINDSHSGTIVTEGQMSICIRDNNIKGVHPIRCNSVGNIIVDNNRVDSLENETLKGAYYTGSLIMCNFESYSGLRKFHCFVRHYDTVTTGYRVYSPVSQYFKHYTYDIKTNLQYNADSNERTYYISEGGKGKGSNPNDCLDVSKLPTYELDNIKLFFIGNVPIKSYDISYLNCKTLTLSSQGTISCDTIVRLPNAVNVVFDGVTFNVGSIYWMFSFEKTPNLSTISIRELSLIKKSQCVFNIQEDYRNIRYIKINIEDMAVSSDSSVMLLRGTASNFCEVNTAKAVDNLVINDRYVRNSDGNMKDGEFYFNTKDGSLRFMTGGIIRIFTSTQN